MFMLRQHARVFVVCGYGAIYAAFIRFDYLLLHYFHMLIINTEWH